MKRLLAISVCACLAVASASAENWPQWRGPLLNGISSETDLPTKWGTKTNIAWKLRMPAFSASTPVVWNEHIFLNVAEKDTLYLWAVDRTNGVVLWKRTLGGGNRIERKHNMSSPSPVTDGSHVWAITGNGVLRAFDFSGQEIWNRDFQRDYGRFGLNHGYGSSPLLHDGALYLQVLHGTFTTDPSYVMKIDGATGRTLWRVLRPTTARQESPDGYATPSIARRGEGEEIIVVGGDVFTGSDPASGTELWRAEGLNPHHQGNFRIVASPVVFGDVVYASGREHPLLAYRAFGRGDVTRTHQLWMNDTGSDVPTPVTDGTYLYLVRDNGVLICVDANSGARVYGPTRLRPGTYSASPVLADGKLYVTNEDGLTSVVKTGPQFSLLAENPLDDYVLSSPAISDGQIFIRTGDYLWAIGQRRPPPAR